MNLGFIALFVLLQIADIWTTDKALKLGAREANPILAKLFEKYPPILTMIAIKVPGVILLWWADMYGVTAGCCALYLWVVLNNLDVLRSKTNNG